MDFDESLPSNTSFVPNSSYPQRYSTWNTLEEKSSSNTYADFAHHDYDDDNYDHDNDNDFDLLNVSNRSSSPPPPPPPPLMEDDGIRLEKENMKAAAFRSNPSTLQSNSSAPMKSQPIIIDTKKEQDQGSSKNSQNNERKFAFLRKGSRKEPSALNRKSPSPDKTAQNSNKFQSNDFADEELDRNPAKLTRGRSNEVTTSPRSLNQRPIQNKESYWGLDTGLVNDMKVLNSQEMYGEENPSESFLSETLDEVIANTTLQKTDQYFLNHFSHQTTKDKSSKNYYEQENAEEDDDDLYAPVSHPANQHYTWIDNQSDKTPQVIRSNDSSYMDDEVAEAIAKAKSAQIPPQTTSRPVPAQTPNTNRSQQQQQYASTTSVVSGSSFEHAASSARKDRTTTPTNRLSRTTSTSSNNAQEENKLIRPVSALKGRDAPNRTNNKTPNRNGSSNNKPQLSRDETQRELEEKMVELQKEIEIYRNKNMKIQKTEKMKEQELAEILQKKEEVLKQCEEEKLKAKQWIEEQKQIIDKERKAQAKIARENRLKSNTPPIRKEKAEIEALQATIQKMKLTHETAMQKWKLDTNRLHELVKDHSSHIENLERQLVILEEQKIILIEFITSQGLKLPKNLRQKLAHTESQSQPVATNNKLKQQQQIQQQRLSHLQKQSTKIRGDKGYAEEVDVEEIILPKNYQYKIYDEDDQPSRNPSSHRNYSHDEDEEENEDGLRDDVHDEEDISRAEEDHEEDQDYHTYGETKPKYASHDFSARPSNAPTIQNNKNQTIMKSTGASQNRVQTDLPPGEIFNRLSDNLKSGFYSSNATTSSSKGATISSGGNHLLSNSWNNLRSSRSSARYSSSIEDDDQEIVDERNDYSSSVPSNQKNQDKKPNETTGKFSVYDTAVFNNGNKSQSSAMVSSSNNKNRLDVNMQMIQEFQAIKKDNSSNVDTIASSIPSRPSTAEYLTFEKMKSFQQLDQAPSPGQPSPHGSSKNSNINPYMTASNSINPASVPKSVPSTQMNASTNGTNPSSNSSNATANRTEEVRPDGTRVVHYRNGTVKEVYPDGRSLVIFTNGDTKLTEPSNGKIVYYYAQADTRHTTYPDGLELYQFPNGQIEKHYPDGKKEVIFPDETKKTIYPNGVQECLFPDGVILKEYADGRKEVISSSK